MKNSTALGALAGSIVLTVLHETLRRTTDGAPRMDKMGEEALSKSADALGLPAPKGASLYWTTLVLDVIGNALFYSLAGSLRKKKGGWMLGPALGLLAGVGGVKLPKPLGLDPANSGKTKKRAGMTIGYYLIGGIVAAAAMSLLSNKDD